MAGKNYARRGGRMKDPALTELVRRIEDRLVELDGLPDTSSAGAPPGTGVVIVTGGVFGTPLDNTALTARINAFSSGLSGAAPASGGGTTNFLRADGAWVAPPAGPTGPAGPVGPAVYMEAEGEPGADGFLPGPQGIQGLQGATGTAGPVGPAVYLTAEPGDEGDRGQQGDRGPQGVQGNAGPLGPIGPAVFMEAEPGDEGPSQPGPMGPSGTTGSAGSPGAPGVTAFIFLEAEGEQGDVGPRGLTGASGAAGGAGTATTVEINIAAQPLQHQEANPDLSQRSVFSGTFTITDAAITGTSKVLVWQAPGPYTGKGTRADEAEMEPIRILAVYPAAGSAVVRWSSGYVRWARPNTMDWEWKQTSAQATAGYNSGNNKVNSTSQVIPSQLDDVQPFAGDGRRGNYKFSYMVLT